MSDVTEQYLATWNATGPDRDRLLDEHWASDVTYVDPMAAVEGREGVSALIDAVHAQFPGFVFTRASEPDAHHQQVRFTWGLGPAGQEPVIVGFDVLVLDDDGRFQDVRGFLDRVPA